MSGKGTLPFIPFVFCNSDSTCLDPTKPPYLDLVYLSLAIYRGEADYRQSLFMQGQDTLVISGALMGQESGVQSVQVGASGGIYFSSSEGKAEFIGVNSQGLSEQRTALENDITYKAPINSPEFTGTPRAPTPSANNNSTLLATTQYVDLSAGVVTGYVNSQISALANTTATNLSNGLATKAGLSAPAFTGSPTADTPSSSDNSTKLATTAYVRGAITGPSARWQGSRYTVSTSAPTGGDDGDFWFQIG